MGKGVLLLPEGVQIGWESKPPPLRSPGVVKFRCRARLFVQVFWEGFISPIINGQAAFQFIAQGIGLFFLFALLGRKMLTEASTGTVAAIAAFAAAMFFWAIIQAVATPFRVAKLERAQGKWIGHRFIFNEPKRLFTSEWTPEKNGHLETFEVSDTAPFAVIDYRIEVDGPKSRLRCMVMGNYFFSPIEEVLTLWQPALHGRAMLKKGQTLELHCHSMPNTLPAIVRVYAVAWEIDRDFGMDYTDNRTASRVVMAPPWAKEANVKG